MSKEAAPVKGQTIRIGRYQTYEIIPSGLYHMQESYAKEGYSGKLTAAIFFKI